MEELGEAVIGSLSPFGFKGFTFAVVRRVKNMFLHARVFSTWPQGPQASFEQQRLFQTDPVILRSRNACGAFAWDLSLYEPNRPEHQDLIKLRRSMGVTGGVCVPVHEPWHGRSVLYLTGDGFPADGTSLLSLELMTAHLCSRFYATANHGDAEATLGYTFMSAGELSPRERQVFGWLAFGKSSKEVAAIMSLSEHTVNDYIASVVAKLKASNRTEAVMRALLTNQIDLS